MDLRIIHNPTSLQDLTFARRMDPMSSMFYGELERREGLFQSADVSPKLFMSSFNNRTMAKDFDSRHNGHTERINGVTRPEYTSLTDVYERALKNVLDIKLNLKCEDNSAVTKEIFDDALFCDKTPLPIPPRDVIRFNDNNYQKRNVEEENTQDERIRQSPVLSAPTLLRRPGTAKEHSSAFHVPLKRHLLNDSSPEYGRRIETRVGDQFGMIPRYPRLSPDFPNQYSGAYSFGIPPSSYGDARCDRNIMGQSVPVMHRLQHSDMAELETRWRPHAHARDLPPLYPFHGTVEQENCYEKDVNANKIERVSNSYSTRLSPNYRFVKNDSVVMKKMKFEKTQGHSEKTAYSKEKDKSSFSTLFSKELEKERRTPGSEKHFSFSLRHKPYAVRYKPNYNPLNGLSECVKRTKSTSATDGREQKKCGQNFGEKEKFLFKLGLARTNSNC